MPHPLDARRSRALVEKPWIYDEGWRTFASWSASSRSTPRRSLLKRQREKLAPRSSALILPGPATLFGRPACDQKTVKLLTCAKLILHPVRLLAATGPSLHGIFWIPILGEYLWVP